MTIASQHGGKRAGAGRPKGTGKLQEPTQTIRVPSHLLPHIRALIENPGMHTERLTGDIDIIRAIPLFQNRVAAGAPTIAENAIEERIDLSSYLVKNPHSTFLVRADVNGFPNPRINGAYQI